MDNWDKYQNLVLEKLRLLEQNDLDHKVETRTISSRLSNIEKVQIENTADLRNHIKRTDIAEARIEYVESKLSEELENIKYEIENSKNAIVGWKANISLTGWIVGILLSTIAVLGRFL